MASKNSTKTKNTGKPVDETKVTAPADTLAGDLSGSFEVLGTVEQADQVGEGTQLPGAVDADGNALSPVSTEPTNTLEEAAAEHAIEHPEPGTAIVGYELPELTADQQAANDALGSMMQSLAAEAVPHVGYMTNRPGRRLTPEQAVTLSKLASHFNCPPDQVFGLVLDLLAKAAK